MQTLLDSKGLGSTLMFTLHKVDFLNLDRFHQFYQELPVDPYIKGYYRFRRLSRFTLAGNELIKLPHGYLFQSKTYNPLVGDVKREFAEIDDALIETEDFKQLLFAFMDACKLHPEAEIGVHQIRTTCSVHNFGNPAPEGIHRDGTDFIGIFSVARNDIQGGETHLYTAKKEKPIYKKILNPGELLLVNDREFFHFTTPIKPASDLPGSRDVFVLTCPSLIS